MKARHQLDVTADATKLVGRIACREQGLLEKDEEETVNTVIIWLDSHYTITERQVERLRLIAKRLKC